MNTENTAGLLLVIGPIKFHINIRWISFFLSYWKSVKTSTSLTETHVNALLWAGDVTKCYLWAADEKIKVVLINWLAGGSFWCAAVAAEKVACEYIYNLVLVLQAATETLMRWLWQITGAATPDFLQAPRHLKGGSSIHPSIRPSSHQSDPVIRTHCHGLPNHVRIIFALDAKTENQLRIDPWLHWTLNAH